jgi:hypothetical protein
MGSSGCQATTPLIVRTRSRAAVAASAEAPPTLAMRGGLKETSWTSVLSSTALVASVGGLVSSLMRQPTRLKISLVKGSNPRELCRLQIVAESGHTGPWLRRYYRE